MTWSDRRITLYNDVKEFCDAASVEVYDNFGAMPPSQFINEPGKIIWEHSGKRACGRKSYLFGQCSKCLKEAGAVFAIEDGVLCQLLRCCIRTDMRDKPRNSIESFSRRCFRRVCLLCFRKCTQNAAEEHLPCRG